MDGPLSCLLGYWGRGKSKLCLLQKAVQPSQKPAIFLERWFSLLIDLTAWKQSIILHFPIVQLHPSLTLLDCAKQALPLLAALNI